MSGSFDPTDFVASVARRLVLEFADADQAGTPGLIGAARENPARVQLEKMLPGFADVGSGIVIDSFGGRSRQQDVVVNERHLCPVFIVNDTPEATYYPVEGVITVGEIKSVLNKDKLEDAFSKIASAKSLRRYNAAEDNVLGLEATVPFRPYGSRTSAVGVKKEEFDQENREYDQLFGFILCGRFSLKARTILSEAVELWKTYPRWVSPNLIVSLNDGFLQPYHIEQMTLLASPLKADAIMLCQEHAEGFPHLVRRLNYVARHGRTVSLSHFGRYLDGRSDERATFLVDMIGQL